MRRSPPGPRLLGGKKTWLPPQPCGDGRSSSFYLEQLWGQPGWSVWKCGRLLLSSGNTVGRKIDSEHRVETVTKLRVVCVYEVKLEDEKWREFRLFMLLLDDLDVTSLKSVAI